MTKIHVILNPTAAAGRTGSRRNEILAGLSAVVGPSFSLFETRRPLDATAAARSAVRDGAELIVAVGGDGTLQEIVNGMLESGKPVRPDCELGLLRAGTGCGFADSIGLAKDFAAQCAALGRGETRAIDVGRAVFSNAAGVSEERYFINECQAGLGGEVVKKVRSGDKKLGGFLVFGLKTLAVSLAFPNLAMRITLDGGRTVAGRFLGVVAANGGVMAGGMKLTPAARIDDGFLDVLLMHGQSVARRLSSFPLIYSGRHLGRPEFTCLRARSIEIGSDSDLPFEADGELLGRAPVRIEILPAALRVRTSAPAKG